MARNLDLATFRNGDIIPEAKTAGEWNAYNQAFEPAWCYNNYNPIDGIKYGKLYNWYAVNDKRGLAPRGWHIPSDKEWAVLSDFLGGDDIAGAKMKSKNDWIENGNGTNSSGFTGLPVDGVDGTGSFPEIGSGTSWWSSTEHRADFAFSE